MTPALSKFDNFLLQSAPEDHIWTDGGDYELAQEMLDAFDPEDWQNLEQLIPHRTAGWRTCLADALIPKKGRKHADILLSLVFDSDTELAYAAATHVAFYCGALLGRNGAEFAPRIRSEHMVQAARSNPAFEDAIKKMFPICGPVFQGVFNVMFVELGNASDLKVAAPESTL